MSKSKLCNLFGIAILCLSAMPFQSQASTPANLDKATQSGKERLVLMPMRLEEDLKKLQGSLESALVEGLQQKYIVFSGEQVSQKAHEIFMKETNAALNARKDCDAVRCIQNIAMAFQAELIATANVTKQDGGYFLALSIQNIFDNKVEYSKSIACAKCTSFQLIDKLKALSGAIASNANDTEADEAQKEVDRKLKAEQLKKEQLAFEEKLRNADASERKILLDAKAADDKRLAELKAAVVAKRNNTQLPPNTFPTIELARFEITKLNEKIAAIEVGYKKDLEETYNKVTKRYSEKLDGLKNEQKGEFESSKEFKAKQDRKRNELISQRDNELARLNVATVAEPDTAPLKDRIKTLTEHVYIEGTESIEAELSPYDADSHQFIIRIQSKSPAMNLKIKGSIALTGDEASVFKKQWYAGLVRPEAKVKLNGEVIEFTLLNDADDKKLHNWDGIFLTDAEYWDQIKQKNETISDNLNRKNKIEADNLRRKEETEAEKLKSAAEYRKSYHDNKTAIKQDFLYYSRDLFYQMQDQDNTAVGTTVWTTMMPTGLLFDVIVFPTRVSSQDFDKNSKQAALRPSTWGKPDSMIARASRQTEGTTFLNNSLSGVK